MAKGKVVAIYDKKSYKKTGGLTPLILNLEKLQSSGHLFSSDASPAKEPR